MPIVMALASSSRLNPGVSTDNEEGLGYELPTTKADRTTMEWASDGRTSPDVLGQYKRRLNYFQAVERIR